MVADILSILHRPMTRATLKRALIQRGHAARAADLSITNALFAGKVTSKDGILSRVR